MNALANSYIFWLALIMALITLYILPSIIAIARHTENLGWIIILNLLPTGIGWPAALFAALALPRSNAIPAAYLPIDCVCRQHRVDTDSSQADPSPRCWIY